MTPMKTSLAYSGRFSRINDAECKERSTLSSGNFIQIQILGRRKKKTIDRNSDKALSRDKVSFNHQPNRT